MDLSLNQVITAKDDGMVQKYVDTILTDQVDMGFKEFLPQICVAPNN